MSGVTYGKERQDALRERVRNEILAHSYKKSVQNFDADISSFAESVSKINGWQDAAAMEAYQKKTASMLERANTIKKYQTSQNAKYDTSQIDKVIEGLTETSEWLAERSEAFGGYESANDYNAAVKQYTDAEAKYGGLSSEELKQVMEDYIAKRDSKNADIDAQIAETRAPYDRLYNLTGAMELDEDDIAFLSQYGLDPTEIGYNKKAAAAVKALYEDTEAKIAELEKGRLAEADATAQHYYYQALLEELGAQGYSSEKKGTVAVADRYTNFDYAVRAGEDAVNKLIEAQKLATGAYTDFESTGYGELTDDEKSLYLYLADNVGEEAAREYYEYLYGTNSDYNMALAARVGRSSSEAKNDFERVIGAWGAGLNSWIAGNERAIKSLFSDEAVPTYPFEYEMQFDRESLSDSKVATGLYDLGVSFGNMTPSVLAGALTGGMGTGVQLATSIATFGVSIYGNAYDEALKQGYSKSQAINYGILNAASEVALQNLLGGIPGVGQHLSGEFVTQLANKTSNVLLKVAARIGGDALGEFTEEYLQEVLGQVFRNVALGENGEVKLFSEEALYSGIIGALMSMGMSVPVEAVNMANLNSTGKLYNTEASELPDGSKITGVEALIAEGLEADPSSGAYKYAKKLSARKDANKKISNLQTATLAQLINQAAKEGKSEADTSFSLIPVRDDTKDMHFTMRKLGDILALLEEGEDNPVNVIEALEAEEMDPSVNFRTMESLREDAKGRLSENLEEFKGRTNDRLEYKRRIDALWNAALGTDSTADAAESILTNERETENQNAVAGKIETLEAALESDAESDERLDGYRADVETVTQAAKGLSGNSEMVAQYEKVNADVDDRKRQNADVYVSDYTMVRDLAAGGSSEATIRRIIESGNGAGASLNEAQFLAAFYEGRALHDRQKGGKPAVDRSLPRRVGKVYYNGAQAVRVGGSVLSLPASGVSRGKKLNADQQAVVDFAEKVLAPMGVDVVLYSSRKDRSLPNGLYDGKNIYIDIEAGMSERASETFVTYALAHELTHMAERLSPELWQKYADAVLDILAREEGISIRGLMERRKLEYTDARIGSLKKTYPEKKDVELREMVEPLSDDGAIREIVADASQLIFTRESRFAEKLAAKDATLGGKIKQLVMDAIKKLQEVLHGVPHDGISEHLVNHLEELREYFDDMMADALYQAGYGTAEENDFFAGAMENGKQKEKSRTDGTVQFQERAFSEQVDDIEKNRFPRGNLVYVGKTPSILQKVGLNGNLPMLTTATHIKKALEEKIQDDHTHGLTKDQIKALPEKIANPVMIMDSLNDGSNSIVIVTDMLDGDKNPVIIAVKADSKGMYHNIEMNSNFILTYYGKDGFHNFIDKNVRNNTFLFIDEKRSRILSNQAKVQFFGKLKSYDLDTIIRKTKANVKPFVEKNYSGENDAQAQERHTATSQTDGMAQIQYFRTQKDKAFENSNTVKQDLLRANQTPYGNSIAQNQNLSTENSEVSEITDGSDFGGAQAQERRILEGMSDQERYEILKDKSISLTAKVQPEKIEEAEKKQNVSVEQLISSIKYSEKRALVKKLAEEFKVFKEYENIDIDVSFQFSRERFRESFNKQTAEYQSFVMMLSCFEEVVKNAVGIEVHNRNGIYKTDVSLKEMYVLLSAFSYEDRVIPVKLEVKEFLDKRNSLHVAIALESIKKDEVVMEGDTSKGVTQATRSSVISIPRLLSKINPRDKSFIKYIPDGFLDAERLEVKRKAIEEDARKAQGEGGQAQERYINPNMTRQVLARGLSYAVVNAEERAILDEYKSELEQYSKKQKRLYEVKRELKELVYRETLSPEEREDMKALREERDRLQKQLNNYDKRLLKMEALAPLQNLALRERRKAVDKAKKDTEQKINERNRRVQLLTTADREASRLYTMLSHPNKKKHIPSSLQPLVKRMFEDISFVRYYGKIESTKEQLDSIRAEIGRLEAYVPTQEILEKIDSWKAMEQKLVKKLESYDVAASRTWAERIDNLRQFVAVAQGEAEKGFHVDFRPNIAEELAQMYDKALEGEKEKPIYIFDRSLAEVEQYSELIASIAHTVSQVNKLYSDSYEANLSVVGDQAVQQMKNKKQRRAENAFQRMQNGISDFIMLDNMTPTYYAEYMGVFGRQVIGRLMNGFYDFANKTREVIAFNDALEEKYHFSNWTGKNAKIITVKTNEGKWLSMTIPQIMTLYCHSNIKTSLGHILSEEKGEGIKVVEDELAKAIGKNKQEGESRKSAEARIASDGYATRLTEQDMRKLISKLSKKQKECADEIKAFMSNTLASWGNSVTQTLYLYDAYVRDNYFPLYSVKSYIDTDVKTYEVLDKISLYTVLNKSFTKSLDPEASNPIWIGDIFNVFAEYSVNMTKYAAFGVATHDINKILNYRHRDENGHTDYPLKEVMERAYGKGAEDYIKDLVASIDGAIKGDGLKLIDTLIRNTKIASVGGNIRVALQQFSAYPKAGLILSPKNLAKAIGPAINPVWRNHYIKEAEEHSALMWWKLQGNYDTAMARPIAEQMRKEKGIGQTYNKIVDAAGAFAGGADRETWGTLWIACRFEIDGEIERESLPIVKNSAEYFKKVTDKFHEVINYTQIIDSPLHRSKLMRKKGWGWKMVTAYMGEPTQAMNMLTVEAYKALERHTDKTVKSRFCRAAICVFSSIVMCGFLKSIPQMWRDDDEDETATEKYWQAFLYDLVGYELGEDGGFTFLGVLSSDTCLLNNIPFVKDIISLMEGYSVERMDLTAVETTLQTFDALRRFAESDDEKSAEDIYNLVYKAAKALSQLSGIPLANILRDLVEPWFRLAQ